MHSYEDWHGQRGEDLCSICDHPRKSHVKRDRSNFCERCQTWNKTKAWHEFSLGTSKGPIAVSDWDDIPKKKDKAPVDQPADDEPPSVDVISPVTVNPSEREAKNRNKKSLFSRAIERLKKG